MADPRFEFYEAERDVAGPGEPGPEIVKDHRWRLLAGNGEIIASSEGYTTKHDAERGAEAVVLAILAIVERQAEVA